MKRGRKGFTIIEVIIATTIFSIVSMIAVTIFINIVRIQKRIYLENAIYEDGRFLMERLSREIRQNAIDYEEYDNKLNEKGLYGQFYGCYASRFYNPGSNGTPAVNGPLAGGLGAFCSAPAAAAGKDVKLFPGCVVNKTTLDINTGQNPFTGMLLKTPELANAFCNEIFAPSTGLCTATSYPLRDQSQLYLINSKGTRKTIIAPKISNSFNERSLAMVRIDGLDNDNGGKDKDGIVEEWYTPPVSPAPADFHCAAGFDCAGITSLENTLTNLAYLWQGFVPISPLRTNVKSIHFYVSPVEDPRKAFAETDVSGLDQGIQQQPHVTVTMTLTPSQSELGSFSGFVPTITLQSTISSRVYNEIRSYNGSGLCSNYI